MKHIVCLTKSYNYDDLSIWFKYHSKMGYNIHLIDNDSYNDISKDIEYWLINNTEHTYEKIKGWPNQWQLFSNILNENRYNFNKNDIIAFIDDDEYLWYYLDYWKMFEKYQYKDKNYESLEDYVLKQTKKCVLVPQILMSTHDLMKSRKESYLYTHFYRRNDISTQGKAIIVYNPEYRYDFTIKSGEEYGHVPAINNERCSIINGSGISKTTYGEVDYNACLRLYHYHIKSEKDWEKKYLRGSAAVDHQWYARDVKENKYFGGYNYTDFTMIETLKLMEL